MGCTDGEGRWGRGWKMNMQVVEMGFEVWMVF